MPSYDTQGEPPGEFRIWTKGVNATSKGDFLFDDAAARSVMAAFTREGADVMIDLEHQSLSAGPESRADAADARGWCVLELRDGELWATNVKWSADGDERIRSKKQRYISPAFLTSDKDNRVIKILNLALVAMPATYQPQALIAASQMPFSLIERIDTYRKRKGL